MHIYTKYIINTVFVVIRCDTLPIIYIEYDIYILFLTT